MAIAFESSRAGEMNIWLIEVETGELKQLTRQPGGARFPVWGPIVTEEQSQ
jgi:Tol biopolymer transport system component